ncbi:hypothetical protein [Lysinibacillus xylanilyticus]|uniref:hypothetical protein n=1 Tax=Lysinibacillus xylanilyticus TaxID=582475 RepID=UPI003CFF9DFB
MIIQELEGYLKGKINVDTDSVVTIWTTFKEICEKDIVGEDEKEILFECGTYATGKDMFLFSFVRQFTEYEDDEYLGMKQLHCKLLFTPVDEIKKLQATEWSMDFESLNEFFNHIENLKAFKSVVNLTPQTVQIYQEKC